MNYKNIEAIPTEFMGIRFRSKSEAMFANLLEISGRQWVYEYPAIKCGDYVPDFMVIKSKKHREFVPQVVEYKPKLPTKTYLERLTKKSDELAEHLSLFRSITFYVCAIDFFNEFNPRCLLFDGKSWEDIGNAMDFNREQYNYVKSFRYDLQHDVLVDQPLAKKVCVKVSDHSEINVKGWNVILREIDDMLRDFAGIASKVTSDGTTVSVYFPSGATRILDFCTGNKQRLLKLVRKNWGEHYELALFMESK
jgi:hypothetical protein